ncbi:MAG: hypothetical protein M3014_00510 [Chloroflexota bacterium]|nr:hypothetical protein [Chloroflexota bacterium]
MRESTRNKEANTVRSIERQAFGRPLIAAITLTMVMLITGSAAFASLPGAGRSGAGQNKSQASKLQQGGKILAPSVSGTKTVCTSGCDYTTITFAVADVNANGIGAGGVTFNVAANFTESLAASISLTATGTSANPIIFQKNPSTSGANPKIIAYVGTATPASAAPDGIWRLVGADYVTIDGIDLFDPNTANPATMEYGYGLFKTSASDGAQFDTIKNSTITLNRVNNASGTPPMFDGSNGIEVINATPTAATTALTPTGATGTNSGNRFYANTIQNCNIGIGLSGYAATTGYPLPPLGDVSNDLGGSVAGTGNSILNFGGGAATNPAAGIRANNQWSINISYNTINNNNGSGVNHATALRGIYGQAGTSANATINNNTITLSSAATTSSVTAIDNTIGSTASSNTVTINNNTIQNSTYATATSGTFTAILNAASAATVNINSNTINNNSVGTSGTAGTAFFQGIYNSGSPTNLTMNSNTITNNTINNQGGTLWCLRAGTSIITVDSNNINNNSIPLNTGTLTAIIYGYYNLSSPAVENLTNNNINNLSISGSSTSPGSIIYGMYTLTPSTDALTYSGNNLNTLTFNNTSTGAAAINGLRNVSGGTVTYSKNKIYNLTANGASSTAFGIYIGGGTTVTASNNLIGDIKTPSANAAISLAAINITGGTTVNLYYNTIYLNASSSGALFGSSAVYASTSPTVNFRNNVFVNSSTAVGATGFTSAYRRTSSTLTTYASTSNNNDFYAGAPGASNLIFYDGTNTDQTITAYKTRVAPRDSASFTENPPFLSTNGSNASFLHINTTVATQLESGGTPVTGFTDDYDGDTRNASTPDVGADEFVYTATVTNTPLPSNTPTITNTPTNTETNTPLPTNTPTITNTPTNTPLPTSTPTIMNTPTNTGTATSIPTATSTPNPCTNYGFTQTTGTIVTANPTTDTGNHCDECNITVALPFGYTLYDETFANAILNSNGNLAFTTASTTAFTATGQPCLPTGVYNNNIFVYARDLNTSIDATNCPQGCGIFTSVSGTAPSRIFNIEWRAVLFATGTFVNFEAQLYEGRTSFSTIYGTMTTGAGTVGVQRDTGSAYTQFTCSTSPASGTQLNWSYPQTACPTNTPVPSATSTITHIPTVTLTSTNTPSNTPTSTPTNTSTPSNTPTSTPSNTPSYTPTITPTITPTATDTPTITPTNTPSDTPSDTPTITPTGTNTPSNTSTNTAAVTNTPSYTPSNTPTSTPTNTNTPSNTSTSTPSNTPSDTLTSTNIPTNTPTNIPSNTPTITPTVTPTPTDTPSSTPSDTPSNTPTIAPTSTNTSTNTPTVTPTVTNTPPLPTVTAPPTATDTATVASTSTATNTLTGTATSTSIATNTLTGTATSMSTATNTLTGTATSTSTVSSTGTPQSCGAPITDNLTGATTQTGHLTRVNPAGACGTQKSCPGTTNPTAAVRYKTYTFNNTNAATTCVTIQLASAGCTTNLITAAYLGSYNPADVCANYLADAGGSSAAESFSIDMPAGANLLVVVSESALNACASTYTLTVTGINDNCPNLTPTSTLTPTVTRTPACNNAWTNQAPYPMDIRDQAMTGLAGKLYSFSGVSHGAFVTNSYSYDPTTNSWTAIAPLTAARENASAVTDGRYNYILSGGDSTSAVTTSLYRYDPVTNSYTTMQPSSVATRAQAAVYLAGKIYKISGFNASSIGVPDVEVYSVATNTWGLTTAYPTPGGFLMAVALNGSIYAAGGTPDTNKTYRYDVPTSTWNDADIADLPATRWGAASDTLNGKWILSGGVVAGVASNDAQAWDPTTNAWNLIDAQPQPKYRLQGSTAGTSFYAVGGAGPAGGFTGTPNNYRYNSSCPGNPTATMTSTAVGTDSPTATTMSTAAGTATGTDSPTTTTTNTGTPTTAPSNTSAVTLTSIPTNSPTNTPTRTSTNSPSNTPSNTSTNTTVPTATSTSTNSASTTISATSTATITRTSTITATATQVCVTNANYLYVASTGATIVPAITLVTGSTCNSCTVNIQLPFSYSLYENTYTSVNASNKGNLQFSATSSSGTNFCLPSPLLGDAIAAYWDDLNTNLDDTRGIYTSTSGAAPNRTFNIRWHADYVSNDATADFEVVLYEGQPRFDIIYSNVTTHGYSTTVGVQSADQTRSTQYECNTRYSIANGTRLSFDRRKCSSLGDFRK